jgi:hypothetical protein
MSSGVPIFFKQEVASTCSQRQTSTKVPVKGLATFCAMSRSLLTPCSSNSSSLTLLARKKDSSKAHIWSH